MPRDTKTTKKTTQYKGKTAVIYGYLQPDTHGEYPEQYVFACCGSGCKRLVIGTPEAIRVGGGRHWSGGTITDPDNVNTVVLCSTCAGPRRR
jgi:hypothetical protein